jgi:hypothetical protein
MSGASDRELDSTSRELLDALEELKGIERRKRETERSSEPFHELAEEATDQSREVFRLAREEEMLGDEDSSRPEDHEWSGDGDWTRMSDR